jgi:predicted component of type VI protein secretion system
MTEIPDLIQSQRNRIEELTNAIFDRDEVIARLDQDRANRFPKGEVDILIQIAVEGRDAANKALAERIQTLTALLDDKLGTPCEQIRHEQEVETLKAAYTAAAAEVERLVADVTSYMRIANEKEATIMELRDHLSMAEQAHTEFLKRVAAGELLRPPPPLIWPGADGGVD